MRELDQCGHAPLGQPAGQLGDRGRRRDELVGSLRAKPGLRRYLRRNPAVLLRVDHAAIRREQHLDGKWLLRTSDLTLSPDDLAAAYKQLIAVERGWRDMKDALGLRPVFHHREDRIGAHVQLCWLALLLIRVIENAASDTWRNTRTNSTACTWSPWPPRPGCATLHADCRAQDHPQRAGSARTRPLLRIHHRRLTRRHRPRRRAQ